VLDVPFKAGLVSAGGEYTPTLHMGAGMPWLWWFLLVADSGMVVAIVVLVVVLV
jgi:hypothetical protein